ERRSLSPPFRLTFSRTAFSFMMAGVALHGEPLMSSPPSAWSLDALKAVIERHWGYRPLRPLQEQAMRAILDGRDALVVLPTGGGKSLCYQAPAVYQGGTTVVLSPLIALMKDQVDGLRANGIIATQL